MSHSRRHAPVCGFTTCRSEKEYKQREHRNLRVALRTALTHEDWYRAEYDVRESVWEWGKDGRQHGWWGRYLQYYGADYKPLYWGTWKAWIK